MERHAKQRSKPRSARRSAAKRAKVTQHPSSKGIMKPPLTNNKAPLIKQNSIRATTAAASSSRRSSSTTTSSSGPNSRKNSRPENTASTDQNSDTGENNTELLRNEVITELIHQVVATSI